MDRRARARRGERLPRRRRLTTLWYQVDGSDSDIATLFHYLTLAARSPRRAAAGRCRALPPGAASISSASACLFQRLYARLKPRSCGARQLPGRAGRLRAARGAAAGDRYPAGDGQFLVISRNEPPANPGARGACTGP